MDRPLQATDARENAEAALRESDFRLQLIVSQLPVMLWTTDRDLRFTSALGAGIASIGLRPEDMIGTSLHEKLITGQRGAVHVEPHLRALAGESSTYESEHQSRVFENHVEPLRDGDGAIVGCVGLAFDTTERQRAESALRQAEANYRGIVEHAVEGIFQTGPDGRVLSVNPAMARIFGFASAEEHLAVRNESGHPPYVEPGKRDEFLARLRDQAEVSGFECQMYRKDGTVIWVSMNGHAIFDEDHRLIRYEGSIKDITARKNADEARARLVAIVEFSHDAIIAQSIDGLIETWNGGAERLYGYRAEEMIGQSIAAIVPRSHHDEIDQIVQTIARGGRINQLETVHRTKDGSLVDVSINVSPIRDASAIIGASISVRDITKRRRALVALGETNRRLEVALTELRQTQQQVVQQERLRAMGEMASGIAHDFNNALSMVLGYSDLALQRPKVLEDSSQTRAYFEAINTAARDAADVVARLRDFYRPKEEHEAQQPVDLNLVIEQVVDLTRPTWRDQALMRGATIDLHTQLRSVPPVLGSSTQFRELLMNLVFNAVAAIEGDGTIVIATRVANGAVLCEVRDTGSGMSDEVRARCLEPFFTTKGELGTGLGLSSVHGAVHRLGGTLEIESAAGQGTTVRLALPPARESTSALTDHVVMTRDPRTVLLVDDRSDVRDVIAAYLVGDGHAVEIASDGLEALRVFDDGRFDLVVTDRAMPAMTGQDLAGRVKERSPQTPVIMLTGFAELMRDAGEMPSGVDYLLAKPATLNDVRRALAAVCRPLASEGV